MPRTNKTSLFAGPPIIIAPPSPTPSITAATTSSGRQSPACSSVAGLNMPSPRSSPSMRPSSPLSTGYKASPHFDSRQPPSPRSMHSRPHTSRRPPNSSLQLPSLPRFHPANFPSSHSSVQTTPDGAPSPQGPVSPRAYQRLYNDAQKQLYMNQREMFAAAAARHGSPKQAGKPVSPRLAPLGSPGPVTPLELEGEEGYLTAGARNASNGIPVSDEFVEKMIRDEVRRQRMSSPSRRS